MILGMQASKFSRREAMRGRVAPQTAGDFVPQPSAVRLRRGAIGHLPALAALEESVFRGDRLSPRQFRYHLDNPASDLIVATAPGHQVLGYALLFRRAGTSVARVYSIAVASVARGQGLGARLLRRLEAIARASGLCEIRLEVRKDNPAALALYERSGYRKFAERSGYYEDGADAWRLAKSLQPRKRRK